MITVSIFINGKPVLTRSAVNKGPVKNKKGKDLILYQYAVDDGSTIYHAREDGAVKLAKKMLDTIKETQKGGYK